uniref:Uncharacterized protein n=1 Tax=Peronospora matthiolae TaxID=2874970 RepID=A0AAV1VH54_9STRA
MLKMEVKLSFKLLSSNTSYDDASRAEALKLAAWLPFA